MNKLTFLLSLLSLALGFVYIYKPHFIIRINRFMREKVFQDRTVQFNRMKYGIILISVGIILFFTSYYRSQYSDSKVTQSIISSDWLLYQSLQHLYANEYLKSKALSEKVLERDQNNVDALYQLGAVHVLMGDMQVGMTMWAKAAQLNPNSLRGERIREFVNRTKRSQESQK